MNLCSDKGSVLMLRLSAVVALCHAGAALGSFSEQPDAVLLHVSSFLTPEEIAGKISRLSRRCNKISTHGVLRKNSRNGVLPRDKHWSYWQEALSGSWPLSIRCYNDQEFLIRTRPTGEFRYMWQEETLEAARSNEEPPYIKQIMELAAGSVQSYIAGEKKYPVHDSEKFIRLLGFRLLFHMKIFHEIAKETTRIATWTAAWKAGSNASRLAGLETIKGAAWHRAAHAVNEATWSASSGILHGALLTEARDLIMHAAEEEVRKLKSPDQLLIARVAYRVAEKVSLLHFLSRISALEYEMNSHWSGQARGPEIFYHLDSGIFDSQEKLDVFLAGYFGDLGETELVFVNPWISRLWQFAGS